MTEDALEQAKRALRICDVYLRSATMVVSEAYDHRSGLSESVSAQFRHVVEKSEVLISENGEEAKRYFRVHLDLGYRWGEEAPNVSDAQSEQPETDRFSELGRIEGKYIAEYEIKEELSEECLDAFALKNASYHVWPYWREFVASACLRLNVPKQVLPTVQLAHNRDANRVERNEQE